MKRLVIFLKAAAAAYELREDTPDLLHAHFAWLPGGAAWVMAKLLDRPFSVTIHAYDIYASTDLLELIMSEADHVVAISEYNRQYISELGYRPAESISVIHCGIDVSQFENHNDTDDNQHVRENCAKIISIGSLYPKKGHRFLIEACRILKDRNVAFECNIIGSGYMQDELQALITQFDLSSQVRLLGVLPTPEVSKALEQHDIFALAATVAPNGDRDGIPVVMMEAGASGLPLVSSEVSGIPEIVLNNQTGFTVPAEDALALANALEKLITIPELRDSFGKNAQKLVRLNYNIDFNADLLKDLFAGLIKL